MKIGRPELNGPLRRRQGTHRGRDEDQRDSRVGQERPPSLRKKPSTRVFFRGIPLGYDEASNREDDAKDARVDPLGDPKRERLNVAQRAQGRPGWLEFGPLQGRDADEQEPRMPRSEVQRTK